MRVMAGSRNSDERASLVASAVVLLLILSLLTRDFLETLRRPRSNALRPLVRGVCSTTGSPKSPTASYVVRLSPRTQRNDTQPSQSARNSWPWRLSCEQRDTYRPHHVLRKLWHRKRWTPRGCSRHGMLRKMLLLRRQSNTRPWWPRLRGGQRSLHRPGSRCLTWWWSSSTLSRQRAKRVSVTRQRQLPSPRTSMKSWTSKRIWVMVTRRCMSSLCARERRSRSLQSSKGTSSSVGPGAMDLSEVSGDPAQAPEDHRVQLLADSRKHADEVAQSRNSKTPEDPRKVLQVSCG